MGFKKKKKKKGRLIQHVNRFLSKTKLNDSDDLDFPLCAFNCSSFPHPTLSTTWVQVTKHRPPESFLLTKTAIKTESLKTLNQNIKCNMLKIMLT